MVDISAVRTLTELASPRVYFFSFSANAAFFLSFWRSSLRYSGDVE